MYLHIQFAYGVVCQHLLVRDGDLEGAKAATAGLGPVLLALDLPAFLNISDHDNGGRPLLPHQPPEIN